MFQKKGVSVLVSYVMLVVFVLVASFMAYQWLKTYVPREKIACNEGVSVFIKDVNFNTSTKKLNLTLTNNGKFDIAGYFIYGSNTTQEENPSISLANYLNESYGNKFGDSVVFSIGYNDFNVGEEWTTFFEIPPSLGNISKIRIIPVRFQEENKKQKFISCENAIIKSDVRIIS